MLIKLELTVALAVAVDDQLELMVAALVSLAKVTMVEVRKVLVLEVAAAAPEESVDMQLIQAASLDH
jgi:hypothetical protein